jgi:hypothetical protein
MCPVAQPLFSIAYLKMRPFADIGVENRRMAQAHQQTRSCRHKTRRTFSIAYSALFVAKYALLVDLFLQWPVQWFPLFPSPTAKCFL